MARGSAARRRAFASFGTIWIGGITIFFLLTDIPLWWKVGYLIFGTVGLVHMGALWAGKDEVWDRPLRRIQIAAFVTFVVMFLVGAMQSDFP